MATSEFSKTFTSSDNKSTSSLVLVGNQNGVTVIPQPTPLTRLNYFDGKFLRASDLNAEQLYLRRLVDISNQAGGPGVVHGYNLSLAAGGDNLNLGPGLAIDPQGRILLLPEAFTIGVQTLIDKSRQLKIPPSSAPTGTGNFADCTVVTEIPSDNVVRAGDLYLITIGFAEALCGQEDVFGKLCEDACVTSTDRPYRVEGIILRAVPLQLQTPLPTSAVVALSQLHLRSRVASSYFEDERKKVASFISGDGLRSNVWCFGAEAADGLDIPLGVIARAGNTTLFLDAWIARRERIDTPAKRYWQWRMAMRPWDVFLAQILQFQCQLAGLFKQQPQGGGDGDDPCASTRTLIREASDTVAKLASFYQAVTTRFTLQPLGLSRSTSEEKSPVLEGGFIAIDAFRKRLEAASAAFLIPSDKFLIDGGIIELPSAGYLPVAPNSVVSVNEQVRRLLGKGLDLRFCIVRPDFVAHALEEAQHMERISLLQGLDHPDRKPEVDILVPDGVVIEERPVAGAAYETEFHLGDQGFRAVKGSDNRPILRGAAHIEVPESRGEVKFFTAADLDESSINKLNAGFFSASLGIFSDVDLNAGIGENTISFWSAVTCSLNLFTAQVGGQAQLSVRIVYGGNFGRGSAIVDLLMTGTITFNAPHLLDNKRFINGTFSGSLSIVINGTQPPKVNVPRLSLDVTAILFTPDGQIPNLLLTFINNAAKLKVEASASWSDSPRNIVVGLKETFFGEAQAQQTLFDSKFIQNDEVMLPTNKLHSAALNALNKLGNGLGDPQFAPKSEALLFPPPPPPSEVLQVRATLDWVLFHRRRTKQCQIEKTPVVIPTRRYQLWHGLVTDQKFLKSIIKALKSKGKFSQKMVAFQRVDVLEFAPGGQTLLSRMEDIQTDWKNVKPGNKLLYDAIANRDAAKQDDDDLAKRRAIGVEQAVAAISKPDPTKISPEVLAAIHPELDMPDVDGIIVLLTILQTNCVTVAAVNNPELVERVRFLIGNGRIAEALTEEFSSVIGHVQFTSGTADVQNNSLESVLQKWVEIGLVEIPDAPLIALLKGDPNVPDAIALAQGRLIQNALRHNDSGSLPAPVLVKSPNPLPEPGCPVILFVSAKQRP
jgi:hypothetical protein